MTLSIRRVREDDARSIVELLETLIAAGSFTVMDEDISVAGQLDFIRNFPERGVFNVALRDSSRRILGLQDVMPTRPTERAFRHVGEISTFVAGDCHRRGIGRRLCESTFREARERGFRKLMATVRADNPSAVSFYANQGFEIIGTAREHAFLRGRYVDEVLLERPLDATTKRPRECP